MRSGLDMVSGLAGIVCVRKHLRVTLVRNSADGYILGELFRNLGLFRTPSALDLFNVT